MTPEGKRLQSYLRQTTKKGTTLRKILDSVEDGTSEGNPMVITFSPPSEWWELSDSSKEDVKLGIEDLGWTFQIDFSVITLTEIKS